MGAAFVLLPTVLLAGAWRLGGVSALEDDLLYYLPIRQYIGERIASDEWPTWNPLVAMGTSVAPTRRRACGTRPRTCLPCSPPWSPIP